MGIRENPENLRRKCDGNVRGCRLKAGLRTTMMRRTSRSVLLYSMAGRIVIPIHNAEGQLVAYAGRWPGSPPDADTPRYKLPPGFRKARELFNAHRAFAEPPSAMGSDTSPLVIVEGFFDVLALWQHGIRRVVALMGNSLSAHQEALIARVVKPTSRIILMLDEDAAGRDARTQIAPRLAHHCYVKIHRFEQEGAQPDSLTAEEAAKLLG